MFRHFSCSAIGRFHFISSSVFWPDFFAILFIQLINRVEDGCNVVGLPLWSRPALGGVLVGALALLSPYVLGVGYQAINEVLTADLLPGVMVAIFVG